MRANIDIIKRGAYKFVLEMDTGGAGTEYICWVYKKNGETLDDDRGYQVRKEFGNSYNKVHYNNFIEKFVNDESYRSKYLITH